MSDVADDESEIAHRGNIMKAFLSYESHAKDRVRRNLDKFNSLGEKFKDMLPLFEDRCRAQLSAIEANSKLTRHIVSSSLGMFGEESSHLSHLLPQELPDPTDWQNVGEFDMEKVYVTLKQVARDWSAEGAAERKACYDPILIELEDRFGKGKPEMKVLCPGSGCGRLPWEIARRGFTCQGNEYSMFMLLASNAIINSTDEREIFPWAHQFNNNMSGEDQLRPVRVPDCNTTDVGTEFSFSYTAGSFLDVYPEENTWDAIAASFFLDTGRNPLEYLEHAFRILKPGGYFLHLGPLLYHFEDSSMSIELCWDEIVHAVKRIGFEVVKEIKGLDCGYNSNAKSLYQTVYRCIFLCARKPLVP